MRGTYGKARTKQITASAVSVGHWDSAHASDPWGSPAPTVVVVQPEPAAPPRESAWNRAWAVAALASTAACVFHGYRRNNSIGWALGWGLFGSVAPVVAPAIAVAQGFGKPAR